MNVNAFDLERCPFSIFPVSPTCLEIFSAAVFYLGVTIDSTFAESDLSISYLAIFYHAIFYHATTFRATSCPEISGHATTFRVISCGNDFLNIAANHVAVLFLYTVRETEPFVSASVNRFYIFFLPDHLVC